MAATRASILNGLAMKSERSYQQDQLTGLLGEDRRQQLGAAHLRHLHVADHQIERIALDPKQRLLG